MSYHLEGRLLEVCNCKVLCPCWIGEDPDNRTCDTIVAWHIDRGTVDGLDVGGNTVAAVAHVPGNILAGNWRAAIFLNEDASPEQEAALLKVYTGQAGGPVADLAALIGIGLLLWRGDERKLGARAAGLLWLGFAVPYLLLLLSQSTHFLRNFIAVGGAFVSHTAAREVAAEQRPVQPGAADRDAHRDP